MAYSTDQNKLIAIISHLATTSYRSGTIKGISKRTGFEEKEVKKLLSEYKEFFVQVPFQSSDKEDNNPYYTLHLRYGLRRNDDEQDQAPLAEGYMQLLFSLIQNGINQENQFEINRSQGRITMIAAIIAAIAAILSTFI